MKLKCVTLTGADQTVKPQQLLDLSIKYPFVEWAILFSQSKAGIARYPSFDWIMELANLNVANSKAMKLSTHLCGAWVDSAMKGNLQLFDSAVIYAAFSRIQLNMGRGRLKSAITCQPLLDVVSSHADHDFIFGGNYDASIDGSLLLNNKIHPLFDASGGRGVETKDWPKPFDGPRITPGYAGGLGPDNVAQEVKRIAEVVDNESYPDSLIWIDMETKIRTKTASEDKFDLDKCEQVLKSVQEYVYSAG
jgi:hypothetical protein